MTITTDMVLGSVVYDCAMDLRKAFDMVKWMELFGVLQEKNVSPIFLRTLLNVYSHQSCNVKWNGCLSNTFTVTNGVRQGAVSSLILFSLYIDELFKVLRFSGLGCRLNSQFYGCQQVRAAVNDQQVLRFYEAEEIEV